MARVTNIGANRMNDLYVITEGEHGPVVAGPYSYTVAVLARAAMRRTWSMFWHRQSYWVIPADQRRA